MNHINEKIMSMNYAFGYLLLKYYFVSKLHHTIGFHISLSRLRLNRMLTISCHTGVVLR